MADESIPQKICITCNTEKSIADFKCYQKQQRTFIGTYYDHTCKTCTYARDRRRIETLFPDRRQLNRSYIDPVTGGKVKKCPVCGETKSTKLFHLNKGYPGNCSDCHRAKNREYGKNLPRERANAKARHWRNQNAEKCNARTAQWRIDNPEKVNQSCRKGSPRYPKLLERSRQIREAMTFDERRALSQRHSGYKQQWNKENRDKAIASRTRRRMRLCKSKAPLSTVNRAEIIARDNATCYLWCGRQLADNEITLDHVVPLVRDGAHCNSNLRVACRSCNSRKGTRLLSELPDLPLAR